MLLPETVLILFRHWSLAATESREKAHETGKISCVRSFGKVGRLLFARSVLSDRRGNRRMAAKYMSERDPLSPAEEDNLLCEDNGSANPSHQGTGKVLANILSAMTQMSSTMLSMENEMKRLADAPEDHATPLKRRRKPPAPTTMSNSGDSDPEQSDSEALIFPPKGDPPKSSSVTEDALLNEIAQDFELSVVLSPKRLTHCWPSVQILRRLQRWLSLRNWGN